MRRPREVNGSGRQLSREWDSCTYQRISNPQLGWGKKVLDRLKLRGDETVIDAGCGTGRLTQLLVDMLPKGRVIAADLSQNMLRSGRENLARAHGRIFWVAVDLQHLPFEQVCDGIFSTAAFHWVKDHNQLFRCLFSVLKPGGWLEAQCGGGENLRRLVERADKLLGSSTLQPYFHGWTSPWVFANPQDTAERLNKAGFVVLGSGLEYAPVQLADAAAFREYMSSVVFHQHLRRISEPKLQQEFIEHLTSEAASDDPPFVLDYWRLNMSARRPA